VIGGYWPLIVAAIVVLTAGLSAVRRGSVGT
jgi:hypothetical protein